MNDTLQHLMQEATRLTRSGQLSEATAAIQRALRGAAISPGAAQAQGARPDNISGDGASSQVLEGCVFEIDPAARDAAARAEVPSRPTPATPAPPREAAAPGHFGSGSYTHASLTRRYKLYLPPNAAAAADVAAAAIPLVVMLHGCTQNADDFAAGTDMNERARAQGFAVLYPEQSRDANPSRCWNWFKHNHQRRDSGEPGLIASLTRAVIAEHGLDARRVYIAGLSAGGAMAAIVAAVYPDIFAAAGVHSGLPCGAASNVSEALAVMNTGAASAGGAAMKSARAANEASAPGAAVPTIVFHGDQDRTVHPRNGEQLVKATLSASDAPAPVVERGISPRGQRYTRSRYLDGQGRSVAEHWLLHGAGHAWSGGCTEGSYTDANGADASGEMLRFFFEHPLRGAH